MIITFSTLDQMEIIYSVTQDITKRSLPVDPNLIRCPVYL